VPIDYILDLLSQMDLSQIIIKERFSNLPPGKLSISTKIVHSLSQFKFNGKGGMFLSRHINDFLVFCKYLEIDEKYGMCILFTPYHMLPFPLFVNLLRSFTKISIGMITEMFTTESINLEWSLMNQLRVF